MPDLSAVAQDFGIRLRLGLRQLLSHLSLGCLPSTEDRVRARDKVCWRIWPASLDGEVIHQVILEASLELRQQRVDNTCDGTLAPTGFWTSSTATPNRQMQDQRTLKCLILAHYYYLKHRSHSTSVLAQLHVKQRNHS